MPNGKLLTDEEVEQCFREIGWRFLPGPRSGIWLLPFTDLRQGFVDMVTVDNGQSNPGFIGVHVVMARVGNNRSCVFKALALANGTLALVALSVDSDGDIIARAAVPRVREMFNCQMLRHAVGAVLSGVRFVRPILQCCLQNENCNVEDVFRRRLGELTEGQIP